MATIQCRPIYVTGNNFLDDSVESAGYRELLVALAKLGRTCHVLCRFITEAEIAPAEWFTRQGYVVESAGNEGCRIIVDGVTVIVMGGSSAQPHVPDDAERTLFFQAFRELLAKQVGNVVLVQSGSMSAEIVSIARQSSLASVVLQPDCTPKEATLFQNAELVLTPTRFAAKYLHEAFGVPCTTLPMPIAGANASTDSDGVVVFDGSFPGAGQSVFTQIAEELMKRRPRVSFAIVGKVDGLPTTAKVKQIHLEDQNSIWDSAKVCLAPATVWEHLPRFALSALGHGVPILVSNRGMAGELFTEGGLVLPIPDRVTGGFSPSLTSAELAPWVETILRLLDDDAFAASQRSRATLAGLRWRPESLASRYARLLDGLVADRQQKKVGLNGHASQNGSTAGLAKLAQMNPWPQNQPKDAAPGEEQGWLGAGSEVVLASTLNQTTRIVVELGSWLGLSTRYIAELAPAAQVISVDHWQGSPEHQTQERYQHLLPRLFETFQSRCWDYRQRVVPLRMSTIQGLETVAQAGVHPDVIYVDAEHSYQAVSAELTLARKLFPKASLVGDDYDWTEVGTAVEDFARQEGMLVERFGDRGWRLLEAWEAAKIRSLPTSRWRSFVLVPHMNGIEWECEEALRRLESAGVRVIRRAGCSAIDVARNELASDALHQGAESVFFIDSDIGFDPQDVLRLLARPEPVIAGIYAKKGVRELASTFAEGVQEILFGPDSPGVYPLKYAATGFLRIRAEVLRRMIAELNLPLCNTHWGPGVWPFFQPMIVPHGSEHLHYLGEDWAFSQRLHQIGITPLADTSIRVWHWGRYGFGWEDAGRTTERYRSYSYHLA